VRFSDDSGVAEVDSTLHHPIEMSLWRCVIFGVYDMSGGRTFF
jgi:hypothetical protein